MPVPECMNVASWYCCCVQYRLLPERRFVSNSFHVLACYLLMNAKGDAESLNLVDKVRGIDGVNNQKNGVAQAHGNFLLAICMKETLEDKSAHAAVSRWYANFLECSALFPCVVFVLRF